MRSEMIARAAGKLAARVGGAVKTLKSLLTAKSETVRLGSARAILEMAVRFRVASIVIPSGTNPTQGGPADSYAGQPVSLPSRPPEGSLPVSWSMAAATRSPSSTMNWPRSSS
jgi:hypothetical protein